MTGHAAETLASMLASPLWLPQQLDLSARRVLLLHTNEVDLRAAAFLDERFAAGKQHGYWIALDELLASALVPAALPAPAIFHIGHCGSTLVSRLLDGLPQTLGLREPLVLRSLAEAFEELPRATSRFDRSQWDALFGAIAGLLARRPAGTASVVIKATSSCNALLGPWLQRDPRVHALLLYISLRDYLATILKSPASRVDCERFAPARLAFLHDALGDSRLRLYALTAAQRIALGWVAELLRFERVAAQFGQQVLRLDFADFLGDPGARLAAMATHLGLPADPAVIAGALQAEVAQRYAKATEHAYDTQARRADLDESERRFGNEIRDGLLFAQGLLQQYPALSGLGPLLETRTR